MIYDFTASSHIIWQIVDYRFWHDIFLDVAACTYLSCGPAFRYLLLLEILLMLLLLVPLLPKTHHYPQDFHSVIQ